MPESPTPTVGINSWLEDELYQQYQHDKKTVDESWRAVFESNGHSALVKNAPVNGTAAKPAIPPHQAMSGEQLVPLRGPAARLAENMTASLSIPVATSQRVMAVKVIDENRRMLNEHQATVGKSKISYTHIIAWAIVKSIEKIPAINHAYAQMDGAGFRAVRNEVNIGIAVDVAGKDGTRSLKVPNIKNAGAMNFEQFVGAFDDIVARARTNKLTVPDFEGTTVSLTNPGTVGTLGSIPRLMPGQGAIIATGAIDYPAEYQGVSDETRATLGLSKVMMVTCTYDHRVIQGAESGMFLGRLQALLQGEDQFYEQIFEDLHVLHRPFHSEPEQSGSRATSAASHTVGADEIAKQAAIIQLIHNYRVRGHLIADLDPLGTEIPQHPELDPGTYGLTVWDLEREFFSGLSNANGRGPEPRMTLRKILENLRETYCEKICCDYMNIQIPEQKAWLQERMERTQNHWPIELATRLRVLQRLIDAEE
ncbi:MAG: 2-oxo acid dehydrogenase subunit E2, partial [Acidobacteriota bacterium]|nr:2-oxo acid dehydrogenase subunit E2 [Acidobacteriota bacterium]